MSYQLTLYIPRKPLIGRDAERVVDCHDCLRFDQDYNILGQFTDAIDCVPTIIRGQPLPQDCEIRIYGEEGEETTYYDRSGNPLTYVYAEELKRQLHIPDDVSPWNRAMKAFIDALPPRTAIVLMWH